MGPFSNRENLIEKLCFYSVISATLEMIQIVLKRAFYCILAVCNDGLLIKLLFTVMRLFLHANLLTTKCVFLQSLLQYLSDCKELLIPSMVKLIYQMLTLTLTLAQK